MRFGKKHVLVGLILLASCVSLLNSSMISTDGATRYLQALYISISLFLVGGSNVGFPRGDAPWAVAVLWLCYFLAPLVTAGFVYQFVQERLLRRVPIWVRNHTIVCGLGRNGKLIYELVRESMPRRHQVVLVEEDPHNAFAEALQRDTATWWLRSDFRQLPTLHKARIRKASRVFITTNQDLANLNTLVEVLGVEDMRSDLKVACHLGDTTLHQNLSQSIFLDPRFARTKPFNGYHSATKRLYRQWILGHCCPDDQEAVFVVLGFGRFGQMVCTHILEDDQRKAKDELVVVTLHNSPEVETMAARVGASSRCLVHEPILGDMNSEHMWARLDGLIGRSGKTVVVVICRDDDVANLNAGLALKLRGPDSLRNATVICRIYKPAVRQLEEALEHKLTGGQVSDVLLFPVQSELRKAFQEELFQEGGG